MTQRRRSPLPTLRRRLLPAWVLPFLALAAAGASPAWSQDGESTGRKRLLADLMHRQQRSADELRAQLDRMRELAKDLRERGEIDKADLLDEAVNLVTEQRVGIGDVATGTGTTHRQLVGLELALRRMATLLEQRGEAAAAEVQDLGKKVIGELDRIVEVLTGSNEVEDLERRMKQVEEARRTAEEIANRQRDLRLETERTVPRSEAEKAAERAKLDLDELERRIDELDRQTRRDLGDVDAARERALRLRTLAELQRRLRNETAVRAGESDTVTPKVNRMRAKMQDVARRAEHNRDEAASEQNRSELRRRVAELAERQEAIARQAAARRAIERAREALRRDGADEARRTLNQAAEAMEQTDVPEAKERAEQLRAAAEAMTPTSGRRQATEALDAAGKKLAPRETAARDQETVARDVQKALDRAERKKTQDALAEAQERAARAASEMKAGKAGDREAREAAEALAKAAERMAAEKAPAEAGSEREKRAASHEAQARRAEETAGELEQLAEDKEAQNAGLRGTALDAARAMRRAAEELKQAARAARAGETERERNLSEAARERIGRAEGDLEEALRQGEDLTGRQGKVAEELEALAQGAPGQKPAAETAEKMRQAASDAKEAQEDLKEREYGEARRKQDELLGKIEDMARRAEQGAEAAAQRNTEALRKAQEGTEAAARKAGEIRRSLEQGAAEAREHDARERMKAAAEQVRKSEEAMRRSLRRLKAAMPKSAEEDRREAREKVDEARRSLEGVRESHDANAQQRDRLRQLAKRQEQLRDDVKRLEDHLKKTKQDAGRERLQDAESAMRDAQRAMERGDVDEAERAQERAEKALDQSQREMSEEERRYRSLRQYELLFKLREELRAFRRTAQAHRETLAKVDANVKQAGRVTRSIRRSEIRPLRQRIRALFTDIEEKAAAIRKERAIVYSYILGNCVTDLKEVEAQLSLKETGLVPQELLGDVVRRIDLAIRGLERDLKEKQKQQQNPQQQQNQQGGQGQQPGRTGPPPLVPADAEIRMVMVLQRELNEERQKFFDNRPDLTSRRPTPSEKARLERMYHKQGSLAELFDSLRRSLAERGGDQPEFGDEKEDNGR